MDVSYCVTGKYPETGQQPPSCYYDSNGNFIAIDYTTPSTIRLVNKKFDYDKYGNQLTGGPAVKGNIASIRMPPNGWTELYTNDNCNGQGVKVSGSSSVDDPDHQISCFTVGASKWWNDYVRDCRLGLDNQTLCQQYAKSTDIIPSNITPIPVVITDPGNNRWWIYLILGILIVLIIMLVLAGVYVTAKPRKDDLKDVKSSEQVPEPSSASEPYRGGEITKPTAVNKPTKPANPIKEPVKPSTSYYQIE